MVASVAAPFPQGTDLGCRSVRSLVSPCDGTDRLRRLALRRRGLESRLAVRHEERDVATDIDLAPYDTRIGGRPTDRAAVSTRRAEVVGSPLAAYLARIHERHRAADEGAVATYIPELGNADPSWFGITAVTLDGVVHEVGDSRVPFTIQSISKPLTYALILDDLGEAAVRTRIGVEPSGEAFNAITLDRASGRPLNPMVNAGAIAAAGLIRAGDAGTPLERLLDGYGRFVGRPLSIDASVEASERSTGHRNRAIGHLLRASGAIDGDADAAVERYFAQCSVAVTAADLAVIAATLANGGINPVTGVRAASGATVRAVLAVMSSCGMYDGAGEWLYTIGLPAKSGVSGGILAVVPGRLGLGFFAPPLDPQGNSVRGGRACRDIVRDLELHPLGETGPTPRPVRRSYTLVEVGSKRARGLVAREALTEHGGRSVVIELQGGLTFLAAEAVSTTLQAVTEAVDAPIATVVLDLRRVERLDDPAIALLAEVLARIAASGCGVVVSGSHRHALALEQLDRAVAASGGSLTSTDDLDTAIEVAEDALLDGLGLVADETLAPEAHPILAGLDDADRRAFLAVAAPRNYPTGTRIVRAGDASTELFLVVGGPLSVAIEVPGQGRRRLATLGPGSAFGETSLLGDGRRGADVDADGPVACLVVSKAAFETLAIERPAVAMTLLRNLLGTATAATGRLTREMAVLAG